MRQIIFMLVVNGFGVKYVDKNNVKQLITSLKANYALTVDWTGNLYCGISLNWDYVNQWVDISMPGYLKKKLQEYRNIIPSRLQMCPYPYSPEPKKMDPKHRLPFIPMHHQNQMKKESNASNKLLEAYCIMPAQ